MYKDTQSHTPETKNLSQKSAVCIDRPVHFNFTSLISVAFPIKFYPIMCSSYTDLCVTFDIYISRPVFHKCKEALLQNWKTYPGNQLCSVEDGPRNRSPLALWKVTVSWTNPPGFTYAPIKPVTDMLKEMPRNIFIVGHNHGNRWCSEAEHHRAGWAADMGQRQMFTCLFTPLITK